MEQKKAKVKSAVYKKQYNSTYGEGHIFDVTFDNGDEGQYFSKTKEQNVFNPEQEIEYTIETKVNGKYTNHTVKPLKQLGGAGFPKANPLYENKRVALKCATDLVCAGKLEEKKIIEGAEKLLKFLSE